MRGRSALVAIGLLGLCLRLSACGYDYDALKGHGGGQGGGGPALGTGGLAVQTGTGGSAQTGRGGSVGPASGGADGTGASGGLGAAGQSGTGGLAGQGGSPPTPRAGTGGQASTGGAGGARSTGGTSGAAGTRATGGSSGAAGTRASGGSSGAAGSIGGRGGSTSPLPPPYASYPFEQTAGPDIADVSGNGHGGTVTGSVTFGTGIVGKDLKLDGAAANYVRLPAGLVATLTDITVAFWVRPRLDANASTQWQRVFDVGVDTNRYMFFTCVSSTKVARFGITTGGNTNEQRLDATTALPGGTWTHVAIVLGPSGGVLYLNGVAANTNPGLTLKPVNLGTTANDFFGRSQFTADPGFDGELDEFRIYAAALTAAQIADVYAQR